MRDSVIVAFLLSASVAVGGLLYLFGPSIFQQSPSELTSSESMGGIPYIVIGDGQIAPIDTRVNYRITSSDQLTQLWDMVYGPNGPVVPTVDFSKKEVLGIFDGSHSTNGYAITLKDISDKDGVRTVTVIRTSPGPACTPNNTSSSPYLIIIVPKTDLPLAHVDVPMESSC